MKPNNTYKLILAGLLLLSVLACNGTFTADFSTPTSPVPIASATLPATANPPFVISSGVLNETGQNSEYTVNVQFPTISDNNDPRAQAFNNEIQAHLQPQLADFKRAVAETPKDPTFAASELTGKYTLILQTATVVSIKFEFLVYISGAAHPYQIMTTVNYDLAQSRQLGLNELFLPNSNYLEVISNYCIAELKKLNVGFDEVSAAGAAPTPENYEDWNIAADSLTITFDQYQVAPGASGSQTVLIPYSELQAVINPQGPLAGVIP
ncbi:MAG TPA: RsiV family protein [Anaerolineales bacterium]|nr:RsiV family protein [Anaerolineales bacterium]